MNEQSDAAAARAILIVGGVRFATKNQGLFFFLHQNYLAFDLQGFLPRRLHSDSIRTEGANAARFRRSKSSRESADAERSLSLFGFCRRPY